MCWRFLIEKKKWYKLLEQRFGNILHMGKTNLICDQQMVSELPSPEKLELPRLLRFFLCKLSLPST